MEPPAPTLTIGTAGWSIPPAWRSSFPESGTSLERYATRFAGAEINSSFHRRHRPGTWARWAASVPETFRFAVKIPKTITHKAKLVDCAALLDEFALDVEPLGAKHGVTLVQLPPSLAFDPELASSFFLQLRRRVTGEIACEPRHAEWFTPAADALLASLRVARVAADPAVVPAAAEPGGWRGLAYWRLHGSPQMYRSSYDPDRLCGIADVIQPVIGRGDAAWCVFDNTASSAALGNALTLGTLLQP